MSDFDSRIPGENDPIESNDDNKEKSYSAEEPMISSKEQSAEDQGTSFKEQPSEPAFRQDTPKDTVKPKKNRGMIGIIISVCLVCLIIGALVGTYVIMPLLLNGSNLTQDSENTSSPVTSVELGGTAPDLEDSTDVIADIVEQVGPSVVGITPVSNVETTFPFNSDSTEETSYGSGFVISADGYILTNNHVVEDGDSFKVWTMDGTEYEAKLIGRDTTTEIAVLKIEATGLTVAPIGDSDSLRVGETAIAIGNPLGKSLAGTVTKGIISALNREVYYNDRYFNMIQTDASINLGNSGGPLLNTNGEVIGVNTMKSVIAGYDSYGDAVDAEGIGFAIPINDAITIAREIIEEGGIEYPGIGVNVSEISANDAQTYNVPQGLLVQEVTSGLTAEKAGVKVNDIITAVDGVETKTSDTLISAIKAKSVGDTVTLTIYRDGMTGNITVEIGDLNSISD
ncbi:MAG: trypsin-like peptidase domain-containing protein [Eubacteriales bacterium]